MRPDEEVHVRVTADTTQLLESLANAQRAMQEFAARNQRYLASFADQFGGWTRWQYVGERSRWIYYTAGRRWFR